MKSAKTRFFFRIPIKFNRTKKTMFFLVYRDVHGPRNPSPPRTETGVPALLKIRGRFLRFSRFLKYFTILGAFKIAMYVCLYVCLYVYIAKTPGPSYWSLDIWHANFVDNSTKFWYFLIRPESGHSASEASEISASSRRKGGEQSTHRFTARESLRIWFFLP